MIRKSLNNPFVVLPFAFGVLIWVLASYGLLDPIFKNFERKAAITSELNLSSATEVKSISEGDQTMQILVLDRWLSREAISGGYLEREPFAGNQPVRTVRDPIVEVADEPEIEVIVDQQTFQTALISRVGLDRHGYFVAFENVLNVPVRKRVGDKIYIKDSGPLVIPTFGIAQKKVSAEELNAMARSTIEGFKLLGVGTDRASDSAGGDAESSRNIAFIQKPGSEKKIFAQGDFVSRLPNLGLDKIVKSVDGDYIVLVDQFGAEYRIDSIGDADLSEKFEATAE